MTLVVTHANGFLGCFTQEADGSIRQRALIDVGEEAPTPEALASIGGALSEQYRWNGHSAPPTRKALPRRSSPKDPKPADRPALIVDQLERRPYSTLREILDALGLPMDPKRNGRWHYTMMTMKVAGQIGRRPRGRERDPP